MAITPEQFRDMCQPLFNLKAHITRIERQLAEAQSERDKALAENVRLRAALGWYVGRSAESIMMFGSERAADALKGAGDD